MTEDEQINQVNPQTKEAETKVDKAELNNSVLEALKGCYDPEIPVNIYELGLIYGVTVDDVGIVTVRMTLTSPHCPAAQSLPIDVAKKVKTVKGVVEVNVDIVWEPPWNPSMMSEAAKLELGFF